MSWVDLHPFLISLGIGLLIGIEREKSQNGKIKNLGVRSFTLIALLGAVAGVLENPLYKILIMSFAFGLILLSYLRLKSNLGTTTEIAAALVFLLGLLAPIQPTLAFAISIGIFLILIMRKKLHFLSRNWIQEDELEAAALLLVLSVGLIPFLPTQPIDPWGLIDLRRFASLVSLLGFIQFGGHLATRFLGARRGLAFTGFFAGLVSSTAFFLHLKKLRSHTSERVLMGAAWFATAGKLLELKVVIWMASPRLLPSLSITLVPLFLSTLVLAGFTLRKGVHERTKVYETPNPLDLISILKMAALIASVIMVIGLMKRVMGENATLSLAFIGGLFELHSVSFAFANLFHTGQIDLENLSRALTLALAGSYLTKFAICGLSLPKPLAWKITLGLLGTWLISALIYLAAAVF